MLVENVGRERLRAAFARNVRRRMFESLRENLAEDIAEFYVTFLMWFKRATSKGLEIVRNFPAARSSNCWSALKLKVLELANRKALDKCFCLLNNARDIKCRLRCCSHMPWIFPVPFSFIQEMSFYTADSTL